jgi:hypothetical protein
LIDGKFQPAQRILVGGKRIGKLIRSETVDEFPYAYGLAQVGRAFDPVYGVDGVPAAQEARKALSAALNGNKTRQRKRNENSDNSSYNHTRSFNKRAGTDPAQQASLSKYKHIANLTFVRHKCGKATILAALGPRVTIRIKFADTSYNFLDR